MSPTIHRPPPCPECGGPADTGAGHDCEVPRTRHTCVPSFFDMGPSATCSEVVKVSGKWVKCGKPLVRIMHGPGHTIDGKPCGFPEEWRYCWISAELAVTASGDLLALPRWKEV